jgi:hypothetical protein
MALTFAVGLVFGFVLFGSFGCGKESRHSAADPAAVEPAIETDRPQMVHLSPPRSEWIEYSTSSRKLTLYDLPSSGRWMVKRSDLPTAYPVGPEHILPEGLDPAETMVYYTRPGGLTSRPVTLAQIQAARPAHVSFNR